MCVDLRKVRRPMRSPPKFRYASLKSVQADAAMVKGILHNAREEIGGADEVLVL